MARDIRTFVIRDDNADADIARVSRFLSAIRAERIDTAYSDGGWHILVIFEDSRHAEEAAQIQAAIVANLNAWRKERAEALGVSPREVMADSLVAAVARYAPTTDVELKVILNANNGAFAGDRAGVVQVVRETLGELATDG